MRRYTIIFIAIILVALGFIAFNLVGLSGNPDFESEFETEVIKRGSLFSIVEANGIVQSNQSALLFWKIPGQVSEVLVRPGDRVQEGDLLASLDMSSLPAYIIAAQAELLSAQSALEDLKNSEIQRAQARKALYEAQKAVDDARFPQTLQAQALLAVAEAGKAVEIAQRNYEIITSPTPLSAIDQSYANLLLAENQVKETEDVLKRLDKLKDRVTSYSQVLPAELLNYARTLLRKANKQFELKLVQDVFAYEKSLARYNALLKPPDPVKVAAAEAELATAKAQLKTAEQEWEEIKDGLSPAEIALLQARLEDAQREWLKVKDGQNPDDVTLLETRIAASEAAIQQIEITAPFSGTVTEVKSQFNDLVNTGTMAFQLDDLSSLYIDLAVSEIDVNRIKLGQQATITFDSIFAKEYRGEVTDIALVGTEIFNTINFIVRVEILNVDFDIKPGMSSSVKIVVNEIENVLLVPSQAIRALNGDTVVYRWESVPGSGGILPMLGRDAILNQITPVAITLGATSSTVSEVISGDLQVGDVVVLNPPSE